MLGKRLVVVTVKYKIHDDKLYLPQKAGIHLKAIPMEIKQG